MHPSILIASTAALSALAAPSLPNKFPRAPQSSSLPAGTPQSITSHPLYVENAPQTPQPYLTSAYSTLQAVAVGNYVFRFSATRNSTGNAFSVVLSSGSGSPLQGMTTTPHWHQRHYETFYPVKGRMQIWGQDQSRLMTPGDIGVVPQNTTHAFQILDPDTYMIGIQAPGGFEDFFSLIGKPLTGDSLDTPFDPSIPAAPAQAPPPQAQQAMEEIGDFYSAPANYTPNNDLVNGSAPASNWHAGPNQPASDDRTPYFMARGWGPYYLNSGHGMYQVIQPLVTPVQSGANNFTMSTISLSLPLRTNIGQQGGNGTAGNSTVSRRSMSGSTFNSQAASMFIVEEGRFVVQVGDHPTALLTSGDQLFVPPGTDFSYSSAASFTKVLYASGGAAGQGKGLDTQLIGEAKEWSSPMFPIS